MSIYNGMRREVLIEVAERQREEIERLEKLLGDDDSKAAIQRAMWLAERYEAVGMPVTKAIAQEIRQALDGAA